MAKTDTIIDAGPLVAYFNRRDLHHAWSREQMAQLEVPLHTCEAVLSETFHLLEDVSQGTVQLLDFLDRGAIEVSFSYTDAPGTSTDSCALMQISPCRLPTPVSCAWQNHIRRIVTTNDDFQVYRTTADEPLDVILPGEQV
jgi:hypothetical protein